MAETVVLKVGMSCQGCVGAVKRVLTKLEGVESFDVDIEHQKVTVVGNVEPQVVFDKVSKTGKKTEFWKIEEEKEVVLDATATTKPAVIETVDAISKTEKTESGKIEEEKEVVLDVSTTATTKPAVVEAVDATAAAVEPPPAASAV